MGRIRSIYLVPTVYRFSTRGHQPTVCALPITSGSLSGQPHSRGMNHHGKYNLFRDNLDHQLGTEVDGCVTLVSSAAPAEPKQGDGPVWHL